MTYIAEDCEIIPGGPGNSLARIAYRAVTPVSSPHYQDPQVLATLACYQVLSEIYKALTGAEVSSTLHGVEGRKIAGEKEDQ
jgi:hypothetical protein